MNDYIFLLSGSFKYFFKRLYKDIKVSGYQSWVIRIEDCTGECGSTQLLKAGI